MATLAACPKRKVKEKEYRAVCLGIQLAIRKFRDDASETAKAELRQWRGVLYSTECPKAGPYLVEHGVRLLEVADVHLAQ